MRPLAVVDLMSGPAPAMAPLVVAAHHRYTAPERPLLVVRHDGDHAALRGAAGIQVTGSTWMLREDAPWAGALGRALEGAAADGIPVLGVCFGHQLLGHHFGATLASWPRGRHAIADVRFRAGGPFADETVPVVHTHRDHLTDPGDALEVVAAGGLGGIQAFAHRDLPIWGVQGHPEADAQVCQQDKEFDWGARYPAAVLDTPEAKGVLQRFGRMLE